MGISRRRDGWMVVNPGNGILFNNEKGEPLIQITAWMRLRDIVFREKESRNTKCLLHDSMDVNSRAHRTHLWRKNQDTVASDGAEGGALPGRAVQWVWLVGFKWAVS